MINNKNDLLDKIKKKWFEIIVLIGICIFAITFLIESLNSDYKVRTITMAISGSIILLLFVDIFISFKTGNEEEDEGREKKKEKVVNVNDEKPSFYVLVWIAITGSLIYLFGFLVASFISPLIYYRVFVFKKNAHALLASLGIFIFVYVVFEVLAGFALFSGILF